MKQWSLSTSCPVLMGQMQDSEDSEKVRQRNPSQVGRSLFIIPGGTVGLQEAGDLTSLGYIAIEQGQNSRLEGYLAGIL